MTIRYRLKKQTFQILANSINLPSNTRDKRYSVKFDILMFLRYIATQSFIIVAGYLLGFTKSSAHRAIHAVIDEIVKLHYVYIKFPDDLAPLERKFRQKSGLPGFVGAIDCTQIKIQNLCRQNGEILWNRKGFFRSTSKLSAIRISDSRMLFVNGLDRFMTPEFSPTHASSSL